MSRRKQGTARRGVTARTAPSDASNGGVTGRLAPALGALLLLAISGLTLLAQLNLSQGWLNQRFAQAVRALVGHGAIPLALLGVVIALLWLRQRSLFDHVTIWQALAAELIALSLLGIAALLGGPTLSWPSTSGGALGWAVALLPSALGKWGGIGLLILFILLLLPPLFNLSAGQIEQWLRGWRDRISHRKATLQAQPPRPKAPAADRASQPKLPRLRIDGKEAPPVKQEAKATPAPPAEKVSRKSPPRATATPEQATPPASVAVARPKSSYTLPPLDLLQASSDSTIDPAVAREKARVIEETLRAFGVVAQVVQVNQGPAVTQFGVQPGFIETARSDGTVQQRKVKVSAITSLADDLALALAARSIRVEAPVPGRPFVGIEVPNSDTQLVTLRSVLISEEFKRLRGDLRFALGRDVSGRSVAAELTRMPHLLIAGATGAGKSVCINTIILSFLLNLGPDRLKLLMIDPKMVELIPYNGIPHLIAPVVTEMERAVGALTWAMREMDRRYKLFSAASKRNHESYNQWAAANAQEELPHIIIIIDELADLMMVSADQVERIICRIAQMSRATGIHLIVATQRPSVDVVTGLIKANIPARISFAVASQIDSRVVLDQPGAEALLGRGDMLFQAPDVSKLHRLQGCFVSDAEVHQVVQHWLRAAPQATTPRAVEELAEPETPWDEIVEELADDTPPADELLDQAIAIVREHKWASTSFLQRKLRIGYTRAARLIDSLEEQGIIGPPEENSSGSRAVLPEQSDQDANS